MTLPFIPSKAPPAGFFSSSFFSSGCLSSKLRFRICDSISFRPSSFFFAGGASTRCAPSFNFTPCVMESSKLSRRGPGAITLGAAGLAGGAAAASTGRSQYDDPYGGYIGSPAGESRYPQPRWSQTPQPQPQPQPQRQYSQPTPPEQQPINWYQQPGQPPVQPGSPTVPASPQGPVPAYSPPPGGLTAQGYPNEKSTYSYSRPPPNPQSPSPSNEGPSASGHTAVSSNTPGTPQDDDDAGSMLEGHDGPRVLKVTNV